MALFRGDDVRLPVLTQLYQVEDEDELVVLANRLCGFEGDQSEEDISFVKARSCSSS